MSKELQLNIQKGKGRPKKLYMVLDCETATLPFIKSLDISNGEKRKLSIAKPLIYDIAWRVVDRVGTVYSQHSFLVQETFFVPQVFNTAYYKDKRALYMEKFKNGEIIAKTWNEIVEILINDLQNVKMSLAYNAMFDYKKAITFTEKYINALYSDNYTEWEERQKASCLAEPQKNENFDSEHLILRDMKYPIADLWSLSCERLINTTAYKTKCLETAQISPSGLYFKTSAESTYKYLMDKYDFIESHTALEDCEIETKILTECLKKGKIRKGLVYFPFQNLGLTTEHIIDNRAKGITEEIVIKLIDVYMARLSATEKVFARARNECCRLLSWAIEKYGADKFEYYVNEIQKYL